MNNKEILANALGGATHVLGGNCYCEIDPCGGGDGYNYFTFVNDDTTEEGHRLLSDIKRIEVLEAALALVIEAVDRAPVSSIYMMSAINYAKNTLFAPQVNYD